MITLEKMDLPVTVTLSSGDWDVIQGLLTQQMNCGRKPYTDTLARMRKAIITARDKVENVR